RGHARRRRGVRAPRAGQGAGGRRRRGHPTRQIRNLPIIERMTIQRMDHVGVVVDDLAAAVAFFADLGLALEGEATVEGRTVDRVAGLDGVRSDIAMMRTPDGHARLELSKFHTPPGPPGDPRAPSNAPGIRHVTFEVRASKTSSTAWWVTE